MFSRWRSILFLGSAIGIVGAVYGFLSHPKSPIAPILLFISMAILIGLRFSLHAQKYGSGLPQGHGAWRIFAATSGIVQPIIPLYVHFHPKEDRLLFLYFVMVFLSVSAAFVLARKLMRNPWIWATLEIGRASCRERV